MEEEIGLFVHSAFETWAPHFEDKYQMVDMVMIGDTSYAKNKTRKQEGRHCIFCNKSYPEVTFKSVAHLLPHMIGNIDLYSTFECDACNNKFSLFETDLASFLGIGRSLIGMKENKKIPGFSGIGLEAKQIILNDKKLLVIHKENAERDTAKGITKLQYQKPTYTPANVYKLFLKCALSVLPQEEVITNYKLALKHLQGGKFLGGAHINIFRFPLTIEMPLHIYIFRKKYLADKLPVYIASLYFHNLVITFPVLLHRNDLLYLNQSIEVPAAPPYFVYKDDADKIVPFFSSYDLSSPAKLKYEPEEIIMQFNKADLENAFRFDPKTGEESQTMFEPAGSKYLIATETGTTFTKDELTELVNIIEKKFSDED